MDPVLSSLFPVNQIGSDGFNWWVGQIESAKNADPKKSGRYRVRIVGQHLKDCDATPTEELPWAHVMMPVTTPFSDGGVTGASVSLNQGNWVVGFYIDNDKQKPIIMGSIGHTAGATKKENVEKDPNPGNDCKSFTTYLDPNINPYRDLPMGEDKKADSGVTSSTASSASTDATTVGQAGLIADAVPGKASAGFYALFAENTATNPNGSKICVEIANPKCGAESTFKDGMTNILSEMLAATQQSGGQLGDYYVSQVNGELTKYLDHGMEYVNKAVRLLTSLMARVKGEIVALIRKGVDELVQLLLTTEVADVDDLGNTTTGPVNPDLGIKPFTPITKRVSRLKPIFDVLNEILDDLGCSIADITDRLAQWLTDLLLGYLMDAYNAATCLVNQLVDGIINQILSFIDSVLGAVLGPLQELLSIIANPLNIIGSALNAVMDLLGISCDGPGASCSKTTKECTDCGTGEEDEDWLDKLIAAIEDGNLDNSSSVCADALEQPAPPSTSVVVIGGIFEDPKPDPSKPNQVPISKVLIYQCSDIIVSEGGTATFTILRGGNISVSSSIKYTTIDGSAKQEDDYKAEKAYSGTIGFAPGETQKTISYKVFSDGVKEDDEDFSIKLTAGQSPEDWKPYFPEGKLFKCTILNYDIKSIKPKTSDEDDDSNKSDTSKKKNPVSPNRLKGTQNISTKPSTSNPVPTLPSYNVKSDKKFYQEGETIVYTITTNNVAEGTTLSYTLSGDITSADIVGGSLTGEFEIISASATVEVELTSNEDNTGLDLTEQIIFTIDGTNATATALILGEEDSETEDPLYFVEADKKKVSEGETITYTIKTLNVPDGTKASYTLSGTGIEKTDIVGFKLTDKFEVNSGAAEVKITISADSNTTEEAELLIFTIDGTDASVGVVIDSDPVEEDTTTIVEELIPVFSVVSDKSSYEEGETAVFTITTQNVSDGSEFQYYMFGVNISKDDFIGDSLYGSFTIVDSTAKVYVGIKDDMIVENDEVVTFIIAGTNASTNIIIKGEVQDDDIPIEPVAPCISAPKVGQPITDSKGSIISIPVKDKGCPYQKAPKVIVTGRGYGAAAIALLDEDGFVSEIRVTRAGIGYVKNEPDSLVCVIDSYTLINPGKGYTSEPDVYINGELGIAKANINEDGFVYSIQVLDRTRNFKELPSVLIQGGGGFGARFIPSLTCLDIEELERNEYAKIGTGKYIDCP